MVAIPLSVLAAGCASERPTTSVGEGERLLALVSASPRTIVDTTVTRWLLIRGEDGAFWIRGIDSTRDLAFEMVISKPRGLAPNMPAVEISRTYPTFGFVTVGRDGKIMTSSMRGSRRLLDAMNRDLIDHIDKLAPLTLVSSCDGMALSAAGECSSLISRSEREVFEDAGCQDLVSLANRMCDVEEQGFAGGKLPSAPPFFGPRYPVSSEVPSVPPFFGPRRPVTSKVPSVPPFFGPRRPVERPFVGRPSAPPFF